MNGAGRDGSGDSHFYPRDFGKIGYLYLHDGQWDGKQIVSERVSFIDPNKTRGIAATPRVRTPDFN
jgi:hypothetical protein